MFCSRTQQHLQTATRSRRFAQYQNNDIEEIYMYFLSLLLTHSGRVTVNLALHRQERQVVCFYLRVFQITVSGCFQKTTVLSVLVSGYRDTVYWDMGKTLSSSLYYVPVLRSLLIHFIPLSVLFIILVIMWDADKIWVRVQDTLLNLEKLRSLFFWKL